MDYDGMMYEVGQMSRADVVRNIRTFEGRFELDFSTEYLEDQSDDGLKHILLAAMLQHLPSRKGIA